MSNDCLVTKLKGVVDNDNLKIFNAIKLKFKAFDGASEGDRKINVNNAEGFKSLSTGTVYQPNIDNILPNVDDELIVYGKYTDLYGISSGKCSICNTEDLKDCSKMKKVKTQGLKGDVVNLTEIAKRTITNELNLSQLYESVSGDVCSLLENCKVEGSTGINVWSSNLLMGDIVKLGKFTSLNVMQMDYTSVTGTLESFVSGQIANGRTQFSYLDCGVDIGEVTFRGKHLRKNPDLPVELRSKRKWIAWDSTGVTSILAGDEFAQAQEIIQYF